MSTDAPSPGARAADEASAALAPGTHMEGSANLAFMRLGGQTILAAHRAHTPLHVQGLVHGTGPWAEVALLNVAGGILGGDALDVTVRAGPETRVHMVTVGATRLYRARGDTPARTTVALHSAAGACLTYLPDETIPYGGALYEQHTRIHLVAGAHAIVGEVIAPGRHAYGEVFAYRRLDLRLSAECAGTPLLRERLVLEPDRWSPSAAILLGAYTHMASLYVCGPAADASLAGRLHDLIRVHGLHGGATYGWRDVVLLRAVGMSAHPLLALVREAAAVSCACVDGRC